VETSRLMPEIPPLAAHQRFLLGLHIRRLEEIGRDLAELEAAIVAEIGVDMAAFGSAQRLAAWAGFCPASHESAGKRKRRGTRKGNPHLKATLVTAAVCGTRTRGSYLRDEFHRLRARMESKKAAVAVAHEILVAAFHMLRRAVVAAWHVRCCGRNSP
jgi:transposase